MIGVSKDQVPLYVRLAADQAARLQTAASVSGRSKRQLVEDAVRDHLSDPGLVVGRASLQEIGPEILTLEEAAALLRVESETLLAELERGDIPARRIGEQWRFSRAALLNWLNADEPASTSRPN
jgi:excisionase family DNA binding protein